MGCRKSSFKRDGDIGLPQETKKKSETNNLTYHLKELEKEEQTKPSQQKEGYKKDQEGNK